MNQLSNRFVLNQVVTAILLVVFAADWKALGSKLDQPGSDPLYGAILILVVLFGIVANVMKAYDLAHYSRNRLKWFEQLFLVFLYLTSMFGGIFMLFAGAYMITSFSAKNDSGLIFLMVMVMIAMFILLVLEGFYLENRPKKPLQKSKLMLANLGSMLYTSFGISICWNAFVIGGNIHIDNDIWGFLHLCVVMLLIVFPFQRLFWYQVLSDAETKVDHVKVLAGIVLVLLSGTIPYYWVN
jgi:hypothetical protein